MSTSVPTRTCIGCRRTAPAAELVRVSLPHDELVIGPSPSGRGAWLCDDVACLLAAERRKAFPRALRASISADQIASLKNRFPDR